MKRILVIERDAKIRDLLTRFLGVKGYDVTATIDAASGMDRFIGERPDLILVDMQLPDKSGLELCEAIRATRLDVALVLMGTARQARKPAVDQARDALGIPQFLIKPFGVGALIDAIEQGLSGPTASVAPAPASAPTPPPTPPSIPSFPAIRAIASVPPASLSAAPPAENEPVTLEEIAAVSAPLPVDDVTASVAAPPESMPPAAAPAPTESALARIETGALVPVKAPAADDPAASIGASSAGGLLTGASGSMDILPPPEAAAPDMTASRLEAVYAVETGENHTWGLESLRMEAIRHGPTTVEDDEQRYALQPIVPQSPSDPRGIYGAITVPNLLYRCFRDLFTGRLLIRRGPVRKTITLANGRPIGAESNIRSESLGYLLLEDGLIDQRNLEHSGRLARQKHIRQGDALVGMGIIDADQLGEALRQQLRLRILSCFAWSGAEYGLVYEPDIRSQVDAIELNPLVLIFDGIKTSFPIAPLVSHFDERNRSPVRATDRLRDYATMLRDFAEELRVATLCDGEHTLGDVLAASPYGLIDTLRILRALEITGCLDFDAQRPAAEIERASSPRERVGGSLDGSVSLGASIGGRSLSGRRGRVTTPNGGVPRRTTLNVSVAGSVDGSVSGSLDGETSQGSAAERRRAARNRREAARQRETGPDLIKADANFTKGRQCLDNEDLQNALAHFQLACKQDPHQQLFKMYRGWVRFLLAGPNDRKARTEAHDEIKAALDADSNQDEGYVLLGNIYRALGREDKAMKLYRKALSLNRRNPAANRAIREMEGRRALEERDPQGLFGKFFTRR